MQDKINKKLKVLLNSVSELDANEFLADSIPLPKLGSWPETVHRIDKQCVLAIVAAVAANRPLLLKGEPGVGKSHMARAAAYLLERHFLSSVIQPHSEYQDLMWTIDHTARLGDAQLMASGVGNLDLAKDQKPLAIQNYISPGPLWWAYGWKKAKEQLCHSEYQPEPEGDFKASDNGVVLLLDEIDKADLSLANGLLEVLGNGSFNVPYLGCSIGGGTPPLVIITSNDTRELPKAFIRRCVVHELVLPEGKALNDYFLEVGKAQFPNLDPQIIQQAATLIIKDRESTDQYAQVRTGQAEFVDLLRALNQLPPKQQGEACSSLAGFFYKHEKA